MTPQEAIKFLDSILAGISLSRQQHNMILEALKVLASATAPAKPPTSNTPGNQG